MFNRSSIQNVRGIFFIAAGLFLLLNTLGFFQQIGTTILVIASLFLIASGFLEAKLYQLFDRSK